MILRIRGIFCFLNLDNFCAALFFFEYFSVGKVIIIFHCPRNFTQDSRTVCLSVSFSVSLLLHEIHLSLQLHNEASLYWNFNSYCLVHAIPQSCEADL